MAGMGSTAFAPGTLSSAQAPNPFSPFFGEPIREFKLNPYSAYGRENLALPDAYNGPSPYLTQLLIHVISEEDLWPTKVALPIRVTESENAIQWDELVFNNHLLGPVPEEGVSRLVTQQTNARRDHYTRYGIAFILEHGFMRTEKGRQNYEMNLMQIRNATLETMYMGVIEAYLRSKQFSQAWTRTYGMQARSGSALRGYIGEEVERYFCIQKSENSFDILNNKALKYLRQSGVTANAWIVPEGMGTYLAMARPEQTAYFLKGPAGPDAYNSALNDARSNSIIPLTKTGLQIFESKSFEIPGAQGPVDPLRREVSVGEYNVMEDTVTDIIPESLYKSSMRDIFIYNEMRDDFSRITLKQAIKNCSRFTKTGDSLYWPPGFDNRSSTTDVFLGDKKNPCFVFGDMKHENLSVDVLKKLGKSVVSKYIASLDGKDGAAKDFPSKLRKLADGDKLDDVAAFQSFHAFLKKVMGKSRVFGEDYKPDWLPTDKELQGLFLNAFTKKREYQYVSSDLGISPALTAIGVPIRPFSSGLQTMMIGKSPIFKVNFNLKTFTKGEMDALFDAIKEKLMEIVQTGPAVSSNEYSLNAESVDKVITILNRWVKTLEGNTWLALYISDLIALKEKANEGDFTRHFAYACHKMFEKLGATVSVKHFEASLLLPGKFVGETVDALKSILQGTAGNVTSAIDKAFKDAGADDNKTLPGFGPIDEGANVTIPPTRIGSNFTKSMNERLKRLGQSISSPFKRHRGDEHMEGGRFGAMRTHDDRGYDDSDDASEKDDVTGLFKHFFDEEDNLDALERSAILAFLHTPIKEKALLDLVDNDIYFPFDFLLFRPRITHNMSTAILTKTGAETGETLIGHADFQLADDVVRKMHFGNFTLYSKAIVYRSDNVYLAENIYATGYVRGNDTSFYNLNTRNDDDTRNASIYCCLVPARSAIDDDMGTRNIGVGGGGYANPMDVTGAFNTSVPHLANLDADVGNSERRKHYATADFYASAYMLNNQSAAPVAEYVYDEVARYNTLCFQGHQSCFNPASQLYDLTQVNTGHFGPRVYAGCGAVRRGAQKYLEPVVYSSAHGATRQMTNIGV